MPWKCPECKSKNTRELWDNTGLGGDIKCDSCGHIWDEQPKRGGLRNPPGGRPRKPAGEKYQQCPLKLPPDLIEWLEQNTTNRNGFIVEAIREKIKRT